MARSSVAPKVLKAPRKTAQKFTEAEATKICNFGPAIDEKQMQDMEEGAQGAGCMRRLTLLALARGADTLSKLSKEEPEAFASMLENIEDFREHAKALHETAETAVFRMHLADYRPEVTRG